MPNGGKDFPAKMRFLEALDAYAASFAGSGRQLVLCGDLNVARTDRTCTRRSASRSAIGQLPEERALIERILSRGLVDVGRALDPDNDGHVQLVGAVAQHAAAQHRLAPRLRARERSRSPSRAVSCPVQADVGTSDHAPVMATFT